MKEISKEFLFPPWAMKLERYMVEFELVLSPTTNLYPLPASRLRAGC